MSCAPTSIRDGPAHPVMTAVTEEVSDLARSVVRLLVALRADKRNKRSLTPGEAMGEALDRAVTFLEGLIATVASLETGGCVSLGPACRAAFDVAVGLDPATGSGGHRSDSVGVSYLEGLREGLCRLRDSGLDAVDAECLTQAELFFQELFSRLPHEIDELREKVVPVEIEVPNSMFEELERKATEVRSTASRLVTEFILARLNRTKDNEIKASTGHLIGAQ